MKPIQKHLSLEPLSTEVVSSDVSFEILLVYLTAHVLLFHANQGWGAEFQNHLSAFGLRFVSETSKTVPERSSQTNTQVFIAVATRSFTRLGNHQATNRSVRYTNKISKLTSELTTSVDSGSSDKCFWIGFT